MSDVAVQTETYPPRRIWREFVDHLVGPTGQARIVQVIMRGAVLKPEATIYLRAGHFVAVLDFEEPIGPERMDGLAVMLRVAPERAG